ncbi:unnamed protein product [Acanthoscelides obtectus]|uniref:Uncharacterized protein n=1 Tax=Acanthoscelides obtectus TaxID=200917 RepID=A0A9P0P9G2_ACAOB|nr:unnamed protein product [Acanthoscelides obtectus]CAK1685446.1 hypothetical protein AOBTE_LOCUS35409 [Acanthoscelides obtectus]
MEIVNSFEFRRAGMIDQPRVSMGATAPLPPSGDALVLPALRIWIPDSSFL